MQLAKTLSALLLTALCGILAAAEGTRIATVNLEKAFNGYYKTKIIDQDFTEQSKVYRNYIARQAEQLRKSELDFRKKLDASLNAALAPAERKRRQEEVQAMERNLKMRRAELEQYAADRAKALQESARKERKKVIEEIRAEIRRRAAIEGYALVLDLSALSTNETNVVLYSIDTLDITDKVLTELNRSAKAPAAQQ
jgi:Skp family chaperone for outer membrane proteins